MQITINVPDTLPQERLKQRIKELEQSLITEAEFFTVFLKQQIVIDEPRTNPNLSLPTKSKTIDDFIVEDDGTVLDSATGLTWCRYALGQHWKDGYIVGEAQNICYYDAMEAIKSINQNGECGDFNDWRFPTSSELENLDNKILNIVQLIFPNMPEGQRWWRNLDGKQREIASIFSVGMTATGAGTILSCVRLVRGG